MKKKPTANPDIEGQSLERKLQIDKEIRKHKRNEQLKSGIKLTTKVIPDKKKYTRRKKIHEEPEE